MIYAAISDKGGTGRTVTVANVAYRLARPDAGRPAQNVCCVDLDLGSPTLGSVLGLTQYERGAPRGVHDLLAGRLSPERGIRMVIDAWDAWLQEGRNDVPRHQAGYGDFGLLPGKLDGGDVLFPAVDEAVVATCRAVLQPLVEEYDIVLLDLSSGRSVVMEMIAHPKLRLPVRWLVHHRWTQQHLVAAEGLVRGKGGLAGLVPASNIFFVRTAVHAPKGDSGLRDQWIVNQHKKLTRAADKRGLGNLERVLGSVPADPTLYWDERLILDSEVAGDEETVAEKSTVQEYKKIAQRIYALKAG